MEPWTSCVLGKHSASWATSPAQSKAALQERHGSLETRRKHLAVTLMDEPKQRCKHYRSFFPPQSLSKSISFSLSLQPRSKWRHWSFLWYSRLRGWAPRTEDQAFTSASSMGKLYTLDHLPVRLWSQKWFLFYPPCFSDTGLILILYCSEVFINPLHPLKVSVSLWYLVDIHSFIHSFHCVCGFSRQGFSVWPETHSVDQTGFELLVIHVLLLPECWD